MRKPWTQFRLTIGTKLILLVAALLMSSIATIVYQSTEMYVRNDHENIRVSNVEVTGSLANETRGTFSALADKMRFLGTLLWQNAGQNAGQNVAATGTIDPLSIPGVKDFFDKDADFMGIIVQKADAASGTGSRAFAPGSPMAPGAADAGGTQLVAALYASHSFSPEQLAKGEAQIVSLKLADGTPVIAVSIPLVQSATDPSRFDYSATSFIRPTLFSKIFSESARGTSYLVDREGTVLAHTDATRVGENVSALPVVKEFLTGSKPQNMVPYTDPVSKEERLASYRAVGFAGMGVVAEVPEALAYQAATTMEYRSALVGLIILFVAFWAGYMYSGTITRPIQRLAAAAQRIASGDFKINLKAKGKDEVAHLSRAFNEMARGLEERDRVKETFNKFHNKEIAEKLLSGEVKLGGERKEATIFFSDVRGFTAMSETMQPEQVVEMLNEYMTRMVAIVRKHGGIVDKYVGDAIMALWGVPIGSGDDVYKAVRACLEMREELAKLNTLRISRGQNPLKIGMGLNMGPVIAGNIGSTEKMEYTVIGDSVNLASRMESMTKEYGTDFLIPQAIYERVKDRFVFEKAKSAHVKGKTAAIEVYQVKGYIDESGREVVIETPYSTYASEKSDKVVHDDRHEESSKLIEPEDQTPAPWSIEQTAELEGYYVKMFGEMLGPFTESEFRYGVKEREFPADATYSESKDGGQWAHLPPTFRKGPTPPPFRKKPTPPPFRKRVA